VEAIFSKSTFLIQQSGNAFQTGIQLEAENGKSRRIDNGKRSSTGLRSPAATIGENEN
jgi:hypothetical protein